jgi:hypothetical protein
MFEILGKISKIIVGRISQERDGTGSFIARSLLGTDFSISPIKEMGIPRGKH